MTSPVDYLLAAMEDLLTTGAGWVDLQLFGDGITVYRGDAPVEAPVPLLAIGQAGPCRERHNQGSGMWEIPVSARLVLDRNGGLGDTEAEIAASVRSYADDLEAILTLPLLIDPEEPDGAFSTPDQRLTTDDLHVWDITEVEVDADTEMEGDPVCEVRFTAFCAHAAKIVTP